jgi:predicted phage terminase large subunit-like protein
MARAPERSLLAASHTIELAEKWGRRVRNLIAEHSAVLGMRLADDSHAAGRWEIENGGQYYAAGVGTAIAGFRADGALIDDPIRSREDADSEGVRDKVWDWYKSDLLTRLRPGKPGEWLWDDEYGYGEFLRGQQQDQPARNWSALFQQRPAPEEGNYFKAEWLKPYYDAPDKATMRLYGGSDFAVTADGGDYTVHVVVGLDPKSRMYLLDLWRQQAASDVWVESFCDLVSLWKPMGWAEEHGQIKAGIGPFLDRRQRERNAYVAREAFPTRGDKGVRAQSIRGRMALEGLYVPTKAPWYPAFRSELLSFPAGKHDDIVDALGLVGQLLDRMQSGEKPRKPEPPADVSGYVTFRAEPSIDDWKVW